MSKGWEADNCDFPHPLRKGWFSFVSGCRADDVGSGAAAWRRASDLAGFLFYNMGAMTHTFSDVWVFIFGDAEVRCAEMRGAPPITFRAEGAMS